MGAVWPYLAAIVPTIVVATFFYFLMKNMLEGDRRERLAQSRFEAEQDRRAAAARAAGAGAADGSTTIPAESSDGHSEGISEGAPVTGPTETAGNSTDNS